MKLGLSLQIDSMKLGSPFVGVLDGFTAGLAICVSATRKLLSSYTGYAFLARADRMGQPTMDIPFGADGTLDTAVLLAFAGSDSVYVVTEYAQYGSVDFTQSTASLQPRIVNAGALDANGPYFNGSSSLTSSTLAASAFTGGAGTTVQIVNEVVVAAGGCSFGYGTNYVGEYLNAFGGFYSDLPENFARVTGAQVSLDTRHIASRERSGASATLRVDGSVSATRSDASGAITGTDSISIGVCTGRSPGLTGNIASFCVWTDTIDAAGRAAALA